MHWSPILRFIIFKFIFVHVLTFFHLCFYTSKFLWKLCSSTKPTSTNFLIHDMVITLWESLINASTRVTSRREVNIFSRNCFVQLTYIWDETSAILPGNWCLFSEDLEATMDAEDISLLNTACITKYNKNHYRKDWKCTWRGCLMRQKVKKLWKDLLLVYQYDGRRVGKHNISIHEHRHVTKRIKLSKLYAAKKRMLSRVFFFL